MLDDIPTCHMGTTPEPLLSRGRTSNRKYLLLPDCTARALQVRHVVELPARIAAYADLPPGVELAPAVQVRRHRRTLHTMFALPWQCSVPSAPVLPRPLLRSQASLARYGVRQLFSHQVAAIAAAAAGRHVVVSTATASGKSVCYNGPVLSGLANDPHVRFLKTSPPAVGSSTVLCVLCVDYLETLIA